jgi:hypothetical protein
MRTTIFAAALGLLGSAALGVGAGSAAPLGLGQQFPRSCASGYHPDEGGNCQPNAAQYNRFCAPGLVYEPDPLGWRCVPPSPDGY